MKVRKIPFLFGLICVCFVIGNLFAQSFEQYLVKTLDIIVSRTISAYNREDYVIFSEYFSKKTEAFSRKRHFDAEFISIHKKNLGRALSKKILLSQSSLDHHFPKLVYQAEFKNYKNVLITVNFMNQNDNYRIIRIRFDRIYDDNKHL